MDFINSETMKPTWYMEAVKIKTIMDFIHCIDYPKTKIDQLALVINLDGQRLDKVETFSIIHRDDCFITGDEFERCLNGAFHISSFTQFAGLNCYMGHVKNILLSDDFITDEYSKYIGHQYDFDIAEEIDFVADIIHPYELRITGIISY